MKVRVSEVPVFSCFLQGKSTKKKVSDDRASTIKRGRVRTGKIKGDPEVTHVSCPLEMLGIGMPRHPETVVEIGDGNPFRKRRP
jgi:hypothetical protein